MKSQCTPESNLVHVIACTGALGPGGPIRRGHLGMIDRPTMMRRHPPRERIAIYPSYSVHITAVPVVPIHILDFDT